MNDTCNSELTHMDELTVYMRTLILSLVRRVLIDYESIKSKVS